MFAPGFRCGTWDLKSSLQHAGSLVAATEVLAVACGIQCPGQGLNLGPLDSERGVLATAPPREVPENCFLENENVAGSAL